MTESEFLEKYSVIAYNVALRLCGNATDAEDIAQDALLRAIKGLKGFKGESQHSTWLYRIVVNTWKNRVRSEKRRSLWKMIPLGFLNMDGDEETPNEEAFKAPDAPLDSGLEKAEGAQAVQAALLELSEDDRAIIILRDLQEQSYQEIAFALELPEGTVKSRLFRARAALKEKLKAKTRI